MSRVINAINELSGKYKGEHWNQWVQIISSLVMSDMRIDPTNLRWKNGDRIYASPSLSALVKEALVLAGCPQCEIQQAQNESLQTILETISHPQRLFCLLDESESSLKIANTSSANIVIFSQESPSSKSEMEAVNFTSTANDFITKTVRSHAQESNKPLWFTIPSKQNQKVSTVSTSSFKMPKLASRMNLLGTETAFDVLAEVNALRAQGRDIISFGIGEPDFDSPVHVKEAAKRALDANETHYGPSAGLPKLREAIARYIERTRHVPVSFDQVVVTPGAKPILFDVMMAVVNPGDEVLYPNPGFPIYESVIEWVGGKAVPLPLLEENNWSFNVQELADRITPRTRLIIINTPGNPTGTMIEPEALKEVARLANKHDLWVIADEIYSQIVFDREFHSLVSYPGMADRTIIVDGFSKTYAMTGWRLGYGVMNPEMAKYISKIETNIDSCTCSFSQIAAIEALDGPQHEALEMTKQFKERSIVINDLLNQIKGIKCLPPQGAFYAFPNVTQVCRDMGYEDADALQHALLHEAGVAVLPRRCFGRRNQGEDQEYIRFSFATSMDNIQQGVQRIKEFIEGK
jgi:aspartate/methionine/tyrosine aminotransferase